SNRCEPCDGYTVPECGHSFTSVGVSFRGDGAEGVEQVENPRAARRSRPRWSRMPSPAVILEPDTGEPEDHAHDDDRDCDINQGDAEPRKAVIALAESLDYLIRPQQQRWRDREPEGLGGFEVDDELERRRLLNRKVGRLRAPQNPIHVDGGASVQGRYVRSVSHKEPSLGILLEGVDCGKPVLDREVGDILPPNPGQ